MLLAGGQRKEPFWDIPVPSLLIKACPQAKILYPDEILSNASFLLMPYYHIEWVSEVVQLCQLFATPWTVAHQALPSMKFSRQEYWGGLPFPSPRHLPDPGIEHGSPTSWANALPFEPPGNPILTAYYSNSFYLGNHVQLSRKNYKAY